MAILAIRFFPDPALRKKTEAVRVFDEGLRRFVHSLHQTMVSQPHGIGIAAPQIGVSLQVFVANPSSGRGREWVVINPVLENATGHIGVTEGCLSIPDIWKPVRRAKRIQLRGQDITGKPLTLYAEGLLAVILQHELDRLEGRLFIDRLSRFQRKCCNRTINLAKRPTQSLGQRPPTLCGGRN